MHYRNKHNKCVLKCSFHPLTPATYWNIIRQGKKIHKSQYYYRAASQTHFINIVKYVVLYTAVSLSGLNIKASCWHALNELLITLHL